MPSNNYFMRLRRSESKIDEVLLLGMPINKKIFSLGFFLLSFVPQAVFAQDKFTDPLKGATIQSALIQLINVMLGVVGLLAIAALVYGGIFYIISLGNESRVGTAKKTITWAIVGLVVVILSVLLVQFVGRILGIDAPGAPAPID